MLKQDGLKPTYELNMGEEEEEAGEVLSPIKPMSSNSSVSTAPEWPSTPPGNN
jgi:hypothetical protein